MNILFIKTAYNSVHRAETTTCTKSAFLDCIQRVFVVVAAQNAFTHDEKYILIITIWYTIITLTNICDFSCPLHISNVRRLISMITLSFTLPPVPSIHNRPTTMKSRNYDGAMSVRWYYYHSRAWRRLCIHYAVCKICKHTRIRRFRDRLQPSLGKNSQTALSFTLFPPLYRSFPLFHAYEKPNI